MIFLCHLFLCFVVDNNFALYKKVKAQVCSQFHSLVVDRDGFLPFKRNATQVKLMTQRFFINHFQKPWPQMTMNLNRSANDSLRYLILALFSSFAISAPSAPLR